MVIGIKLTFKQIATIEPRLQALYNEAKYYQVTENYCPVTVWYHEFKPRMIKLVGFCAAKPEIKSSAAYDVSYKTINEALPGCPKGCRRCG